MNKKRSIRKSNSSLSIDLQENFKHYKPRNRKSIKTTVFDNESSGAEEEINHNLEYYDDNHEFDTNIFGVYDHPDKPELIYTNDENISIVENRLSNVSFNEEILNTSNEDSNVDYSVSEDANSDLQAKLHQYSSVTVTEASFVLNCFKTRSSLSDVCLNNLLKLIYAFLPHENNLPRNMNQLNDIIISQHQKIHTQMYCVSCLALLSIDKKCHTFQHVTIEPQICNLITAYYKEIKQYNRKDLSNDLAHTEYNKSGHLQGNHLNLILYTDGIQLTKNKKHFWPIILSIVELPKNIRDSKRNKVIAGC